MIIIIIIMIWDNLPDCLLEKAYKKILLTQSDKLLNDISNYKYTINYIRNNLEEHKFDDGADEWYVLLLIIDIYNSNEDELKKTMLFLSLKKYVKENKNLLIRYQGGFYWINRYIAKMSIIDRKQLIDYLTY
jgi:hypothetical protein